MTTHSDPPRLREGTRLGALRAALDEARSDLPTPDRMAEIEAAVTAALAAPASPSSAPPSSAPPAAPVPAPAALGGGGSLSAGKLALAALVIAGGAALGARLDLGRTPEDAPPSVATARVAPTVATERDDDVPDEAAPIAPAPPSATVTARALPAPSEIELLATARAAASSSPGAALVAIEKHRRAYPRGVLAQEREVLAVDVLLRLGRVDAARRRAARFLAAHPESPHGSRVRSMIEGASAARDGNAAEEPTPIEQR